MSLFFYKKNYEKYLWKENYAMSHDCFSFIIYIIHACANQWNTSPSKVYKALKQSGCLNQYLIPHFDILHTQSTDYIVEDVATYLREREVAVWLSIMDKIALLTILIFTILFIIWILAKDFMLRVIINKLNDGPDENLI